MRFQAFYAYICCIQAQGYAFVKPGLKEEKNIMLVILYAFAHRS
jgi:hypothetical protein